MNGTFAWLGLSDEETDGNFKWSDGRPLGQFMKWTAGYSQFNGTVDYVKIERATGNWYNVLGNESIASICTKRGKLNFDIIGR